MKTRIHLYVNGQASGGYNAHIKTIDDVNREEVSVYDHSIRFETTDGRAMVTNMLFLIEDYEE